MNNFSILQKKKMKALIFFARFKLSHFVTTTLLHCVVLYLILLKHCSMRFLTP